MIVLGQREEVRRDAAVDDPHRGEGLAGARVGLRAERHRLGAQRAGGGELRLDLAEQIGMPAGEVVAHRALEALELRPVLDAESEEAKPLHTVAAEQAERIDELEEKFILANKRKLPLRVFRCNLLAQAQVARLVGNLIEVTIDLGR